MRNPWLMSFVSSIIGALICELSLVMAIIVGKWTAIGLCILCSGLTTALLGYCVSEYLRWAKAKRQYDAMVRLAEEFEKEQSE